MLSDSPTSERPELAAADRPDFCIRNPVDLSALLVCDEGATPRRTGVRRRQPLNDLVWANRVMGRIVLATMGSWGDIFPVIGLAKGLTEAGHDVRIAASPAYDELVQGEGLEFSGIGPALGFSDYAREPKILSGRLGGFVGFSHLFRRFIFPALDRYVDDLAASIRGADLLLAHPALIAAPVAAEHVGVRWATISVFPGLIPTAYAPPAPTRISLGVGRTGRALHRAAWSAARFNMARLFDPQVNRSRQRLGLPPASNSFFVPVESGQPYLVMASPAVIDWPADWPANVTLTGRESEVVLDPARRAPPGRPAPCFPRPASPDLRMPRRPPLPGRPDRPRSRRDRPPRARRVRDRSPARGHLAAGRVA